MAEVRASLCRNCLAFCPILVTVEDGAAVSIVGDPAAAAVFEGYTCPKGRILPEQLRNPDRLLGSMRRRPDGKHEPVESGQAIAEIAAKLRDIVESHGPESVAIYIGTGTTQHQFGSMMGAALLRAIGSPMVFSAATIDKPAEKTSMAMHGNWLAGAQSFEDADSWMLVGANPVIAKSNGLPYNNPARRLKQAADRGIKLIVIDPRRTETARRAHVHLQAIPGEDPALLAGIIHIIIAEDLYDADFVAENADGFEALRDATAPFTPGYVAERAGVPVDDLVAAARAFGGAKRGGVICATGPSFSLNADLTFYLGLCLNTLCGRWTRAGDIAPYPNVLLPAFTPRAQPQRPYAVFGEHRFRVLDVRQNASGMPTAVLPDEMLLPGKGQIKALICIGGNPVVSWPDQRKTEAGLRELDLLVSLDVQMSATAQLAHYVIAPPMSLEVPGSTYMVEGLKYLGVSRGHQIPWAQYSPAAVDVPRGSDLVEEHAFFFRVGQAMGVELEMMLHHGLGAFEESPPRRMKFDMGHVPTLDELLEMATEDARIPLAEVKKHPHGKLFDVAVRVEPRDPACTDMLQIGEPAMMAELAKIRAEGSRPANRDTFPYLLVSRRANVYMNSIGVDLPGLNRGKLHNPLWVNPGDMTALGIGAHDVVRISSTHGAILGVVEPDETMRRGVVAMTHGFGAQGDAAERNPWIAGSNVNLLLSAADHDPITGIPRMSAIPVTIEPEPLAAAATPRAKG